MAGNGNFAINSGNSTGYTLGVAIDPAGNIYVAGGNTHVIRKITPGGVYSTFAGTGTAGYAGDGGAATSAQLNSPVDVFVINNNLYIADLSNRYIRKVDLSTNVITTVAGNNTTGISGNGIGFTQGAAADAAGNIYVATGNGHVIRKITPAGIHSTFAGTGTAGFSGDGGAATSAQLNSPVDVFVSGNALYIADLGNRYIRKVDLSTNVITTVAGDGTTNISGNGIGFPNGVAVDGAGNILVAAGNGHAIRKITPAGVHSTVAGTGTAGFSGDGGAATSAQVASPIDMSALGNDIYIADRDNYRIRKVTNLVVTAPTVTTTAATSITSTSAVLGGNATADGGSTVTDRGVVYSSTNTTPTTSDTKDANGSGTGTFSESITGLTAGTTYYVRAYAINSAGTSYGSVVSFTTPPNAPVVTVPANGSLVNSATPTYDGTALATSTVAVIVDGSAIGTTTANAAGNWTLTQPTALAQGSHTVRATAQLSGSGASASSNTNTFIIDSVRPTAAISSTASTPTSTSPIPVTVTFSENVTGFVAGDVTVSNGTLSGFSGSGTTYSFNVTPTAAGTVTVNVPANVAQDAASNFNTAATQFSIQYNQPSATVVSVTRLTPSPTATTTVNYQVVFSAAVTGISTGNFSVASSTGASVTSVSGSGTTYTVQVNTGSGNGILTLYVQSSAGVSPSVTGLPYTSGETYTITKSFAAAPTLRIQAAGSASNNSDVTAFVDVVQVLNTATSTAVGNALQNNSFETNNVAPGNYLYQSQGVIAAPWTFGVQAGVSRNNSAFGSTAASGDAVAFLQSAAGNNGSVSQSLAVPTGSYQVSFQAIQRNYTALDQRLNVFVNDVFVGSLQPNNIPTYGTFTSATFSVTAPALTATISSTASNPTSTSPIPVTVTFSASVTGFTASDVAVSNGTLSGFAGSGTTYTFNVTPTTSGTVTVNVPANSAVDANNTGNTAATQFSTIYSQPVTPAPVVVEPANGSLVNNNRPVYGGTAAANSTVTVYVDGSAVGTTTANGSGTWGFIQPTALAQGSHTVYATAQLSGLAVSANSNTNTFTVDSIPPTVVVSSPGLVNGGSTNTSPVFFSVSFFEAVTGFTASDVVVSNGTVSGFSGSGTTYSFNVTPTTSGTFTVSIPANVAQDAAGNGNVESTLFSATYAQPVTAAPVVTVPANGSLTNSTTPTYSGTAVASSTVTVYVDGTSIGTTTATAGGSFSLLQPTALAQGSHTVRATAQASGQAVSANSATNTFTVDSVRPTAAISSTASTPTSTSPIPVTVTFSENVTGFVAGDVTVSNGTLSGFSGSGTTYSFNVTPTAAGTVTVNVPANVAQDAASNFNTAATQFSIQYAPIVAPTVATAAATTITTTSAVLGGNVTADGGAAVTERGVVYSSTTAAPTTADAKAASGSGTGAFSVAVSGLTPGATYYVRAYAINGAGTTYGNLVSFIATPDAPRVTVPSNGSVANTTTPTYFGVSQAGSTVTIYVDGASIGTTFTNGGGIFSLAQPTALAQGSHTVYATAQLSGSAVSANSSTNTFTIDSVQPTVAISSTASNPTTNPAVPVTVTFSESVTGFVAADVTVTNGTLSAFSGSGSTYSFVVTAATAGTVTVNVPANVAQDAAGNGNTAATQFSIQYNAPATATTWTGSSSADWFTASNWTAGVPTSTLDAFINAGSPRYPVLTTGTASVKNLILATNASLTQSGGVLVVNGDGFAIDGTFNATGGLVSLTGGTEQRIGGTRTAFWDLTVGTSGARLDGPVDIQHLLTLNGNLSTIARTFTLLSNSTATAMVVNNGGLVLGTATVQRYINPSLNPGLGYRHYSSPVQATTVADLATSGFSPVVNPDYNTQGNTVNPFPTVYGYDESRIAGINATTQDFEFGYFSPGSLGSTLNRGRGYTVNIAADQKVDLVGTLNSGTVSVGALSRGAEAASGWQLLGNPYPAPLDWKKARTGLPTGVQDAIYVYKSSGQYDGTYQFYQNGFGTLPGGIIGSMQGFFVRVSQPVASFSFQDTWRSTTYEDPSVNRPAADARPALQLDLVSSQGVHDPAYVYFEEGATAGVDNHYDAEKLPNTTGLNLASVAAGTGLAVNGLPVLTTNTVVPLTVGVPVTGTYTLEAASLANFGTTAVYLLDAETGQQVNLQQQPSYRFAASNAALITGRFSLTFGGLRPLATGNSSLAASVALYPNPTRKMAWVELPATLGRKPVTATLLDAVGRVVRTQQLPAAGNKAHALTLDELPVGVYMLRLSTEAGLVTKRLIIE
ncbi:Ig-like domain-containing protein [Hymenobacter metallicola]|uniref:Ig-like domain-containing protein n=1 Tax=Hymenobacter metallicola TaxID=2563114 RepID=UPI0014369566|nr:Ig-like domain-containing protein [Hymenobacter metallicola]